MSYPKMTINLEKIRNNVEVVVKLCNEHGIKVAGVTKVFCGNPNIAQSYIDGGVSYLADSRIENLIRLKDFHIPKIMLRLPMKSEVEKVVDYADISLNSEIDTIKAISAAALKRRKIHKIILMMDLGDLREGYYEEEALLKAVEEVIELQGVQLIGIGTNMTCYGGIIPKKETLERLAELDRKIEEKHNIKLEMNAGGNSSALHLLYDNEIQGLNLLRIGEAFVLGTESSYGQQLEGTENDAFRLQVEIIEIKEKPSLPAGEIGKDAFGNVPVFVDRGVRKRILCAVGKQDIDFGTMDPIDEGIIILGGSSDHIILDGSDSKIDYKVGDIIEFRLSYVSILRGMTSEYIEKELI